MRQDLTIGEFAEMFGISTSKIRYYEKAGLLKPHKIDDNGYRLYSYEQLDRLDLVLLLRKLGVSLKQMKVMLNDYTVGDYISILSHSLESLDKQIKDLQTKRKSVVKRIAEAKKFLEEDYSYNIKQMPERKLVCIGEISDYSIKEAYQLSKVMNLPFLYTYQNDCFFAYQEGIVSVFKKFEENLANGVLPEYTLPAGEYLCHGVLTDTEDFVLREIDKLHRFLKQKGYKAVGGVILNENFKYSYYYANKVFCEMQIRIERVNCVNYSDPS